MVEAGNVYGCSPQVFQLRAPTATTRIRSSAAPPLIPKKKKTRQLPLSCGFGGLGEILKQFADALGEIGSRVVCRVSEHVTTDGDDPVRG